MYTNNLVEKYKKCIIFTVYCSYYILPTWL